jgi:signal transduction histidine kinase
MGLYAVGQAQDQPAVKSAQVTILDSLKEELVHATGDSMRMEFMSQIGFRYEFINIDSSLKYTQAALELAKRRRDISAEVALTIDMAAIFREEGKLAESLDTLLQSITIAEKNNLYKQVARAYRRLADVYFDLKNFPKAIEYLAGALKIDEQLQLKRSMSIDYMTLGYAYEKLNMLDSASFYANMVLQKQDHYAAQYAYQVMGNVHSKKGNVEAAASFFREGLVISLQNQDLLTATEICADFSSLFIKHGQRDSAIIYALRGFGYGREVSFKKGVMLCGTLLASLYDSTQPATALRYYKIATAAKDSLFGVDNIQTIQNLVSREQAKLKELENTRAFYRNRLKVYGLLAGLSAVLIITIILYRNNRHKQKANELLQQQKQKVENALSELKSAQAQLVQSEKMASLGELTAGIAHEIQNPLNFVNNFSEVNKELLEELKAERLKHDADKILEDDLIKELIDNSEKINHHGKRADKIVKGMLQHSRASSGVKEPTDINALCDEYLRLAYHGFRAKDKSFNSGITTDLDPSIGKINIIPQDVGRVVLNLFNNALYALTEKQKGHLGNYEPNLSLRTKNLKTISPFTYVTMVLEFQKMLLIRSFSLFLQRSQQDRERD